MDMDFPHKKLEWIARDAGSGEPVQITDHQALFTRAIARQASSQSAQGFIAASQVLEDTKTTVRSSFMDERMAFFAGRVPSGLCDRNQPILFKTGCFRPDLAQREISKMQE